jgi:hypothetical protein
MAQSAIINSPLMRWVSGDLDKKRDKDHKQRPIPPDKQMFEIGLAVAKDNPGLPAMFQAICAHLWTECAQHPHIQQKIQVAMQYFPLYVTSHNPQALDGFSWKMWDGDKPNAEGQVSEYSRGHWVFYFKSQYPFTCGNAQNAEIPVTALKRGDYVDMAFTCSWNGLFGADDAGVYLNPRVLRLQFEGPAIGGGAMSPAEAFANAPQPQYQMPVGAKVPGALPSHAANPMAMPGGAPMPGQGAPGFPAGLTPQAGAPTTAPGGFAPTHAAPAMASPSSAPGFPAAAVPGQGAPAAFPGGNAPSPTGFPSNVQPHPTFASGPAPGGPVMGQPGYPGT